jgi:uncharacterized membrane protein
MATVRESIEVDVPVQTAYNQWTQLEDFPKFMEGVKSVQQVDDTHVRWVAEIGGQEHEWLAEVSNQERDRRISWRSVDGKYTSGEVMFEPAGTDQTRIDIEMTYDPEGFKEAVGSTLGIDSRRVKGDLERFKELVESQGVETGAWRGEVRQGQVTDR